MRMLTAWQAAVRSFRKKGNISGYIWLCSDTSPFYNQGQAAAAALQIFVRNNLVKNPVLLGHLLLRNKSIGYFKIKILRQLLAYSLQEWIIIIYLMIYYNNLYNVFLYFS